MMATTNENDAEDASRFRLATYLGPESFPARFDELIVSLLRAHAPSRLLARVACLPPTTHFGSLAELEQAVGLIPDQPATREDR